MTPTAMGNIRLAIVGALHVDDIARSTLPLVSRASNPVNWEQRLGGVAANAARAAALSGIDLQTIDFMAAVGEDALSGSLARALSACDIVPKLKKLPGFNTGRYTAILNNDGELHIGLADVSLAEKLDSTHLLDLVQAGPYSALMVDANLSGTCLDSMAELSANSKTPLAALTVSPSKSLRLRPIAAQVDLLFCNRREAMALIADDDAAAELNDRNYLGIEQLADGLAGLGFKQIVLTDAQAPILVQEMNKRYQIPVPLIDNPYTVNGAGDAMAGASFAAWATGVSLYESVKNTGLAIAAAIVSGEQRAVAL